MCNHCKTLLVKERDTDQSEVYSFEKKQYDSATDSGLFTRADTLRKVFKAAEHSIRENASSLVISTALRFKLVKKMINAALKKKKKKKTITWFARRKVYM